MDKGQIAVDNFKSGLNCAQAVVLAFQDELKMDSLTLKKLTISFGGGLGRQRFTCGAVSGMCMVLGGLLSDGQDKLYIYDIIQKACQDFKEQVGSIICAELLDGESAKSTNPKPDDRTTEYYKKRPCAELCRLASQITQKYLEQNI